MNTVWEILSGAPWWVYLLLILLVRLGIRSFKPRTIQLPRLILLPSIFFLWSIYRLYQNDVLVFPSLIVWWVLALAVGAYLGFKEVHAWKIHVDKAKKTLTIPGNYSTLILIVAVFILNFFWGTLYSIYPEMPYGIRFFDTVTTTICTGFFVGRGSLFLKRYMAHR
jgi:hypothetical protein